MRTLTVSDPALVASAGTHDAWAHYRAITITNTGGSAKTNWPVRVSLTAADVGGGGEDLQFRAADGVTVLPHWIEDWSTTGHVWVKVPSISAGGSVTVRCYYDNPTAVDASDIEAVFLLGEDFRAVDAVANMGGGSIARPSIPTLGNSAAYASNPIAMHGGTGWRQTQVREQSNIVWTGSEWVFLVTGVDAGGTSTGTSSVGLYTATDLAGTWTEYVSNPVLPNAEDPYICVNTDGTIYTDGSGWHYVMFERKATAGGASSQLDTGVARTKNFRTDWEVWNGTAWTTSLSTHAAVLARGTTGAWDDTFTGSPTVVWDGTQAVCVYEGAKSTDFRAGVARSSNFTTWTKEASNPILTTDVIDDLVLISGVWWATFHANSGDQYRLKSTTDAPAAWSSTSFTTDPAAKYEAGGQSVNLVFGPDGNRWATGQETAGTTGMELFNWMGVGAKWDAQRFTTTDAEKSSFLAPIDVTGGELVLKPYASGFQHQLAVWSVAAPLTYDWEVCFRRKVTVQTDDQYQFIAVGSGAVTAASGYVSFADGYVVGVLDPALASVGALIRKNTSGSFVDQVGATGPSATLTQNYARHQVRYTSAGVITYLIDGSSIVTRTDTTHKAASKKLALWQGHSPSSPTRPGGISHYEWVFARPFDGVDPSTSVGSEIAT